MRGRQPATFWVFAGLTLLFIGGAAWRAAQGEHGFALLQLALAALTATVPLRLFVRSR